MALQDVIERIQYHARQVTGIRAAPDNFDLDAANHAVWAWSFPASGTMGVESYATGHDLHTIQTDIHYTGSETRIISVLSESLIESFVNKIRGDITLNGTVQTVVAPIEYSMTPRIDQDKKELVFSFRTTVKMRPTFTVS